MNADDLASWGLAVLPINPSTKRTPTNDDQEYAHGFAWKYLQERLPTAKEIAAWQREYPGCWVGYACGKGSGNVEVLDFDPLDKHSDWFEPPTDGPSHFVEYMAVLTEHDDDLARKLVIVRTISGGRHIVYRCSEIAGNDALAKTADSKDVLIETRGQGGLVVSPPSPGYELVQGELSEIPTLTIDERDLLFSIAAHFDQREPEEYQPPSLNGTPASELPGGIYNATHTGCQEAIDLKLFETTNRTYKGARLFKRVGSKNSHGAIEVSGGRIHVFSTGTALKEKCTYDAFGVRIHALHGGNPSAAAKELFQMGYKADPVHLDEQTDDLPAIYIGRELHEMSNDAFDSLVGRADVLMRGGRLAHVARDEHGAHYIQEYQESSLRGVLARSAHWFKRVKDGKDDSGNAVWRDQPVAPPIEVVRDILAFDSTGRGFNPVTGVSGSPIFTSHGVVETYGIHSETGWFVGHEGKLPRFSLDEARKILDDWVVDFPFDGEASKAHFLAVPLTMLTRSQYALAPAFLADAATPGTGKTLSMRVGLALVIGRDPAAKILPKREEELEKLLSGTVLCASPALLLDNVDKRVDSPALAAVLTSAWYGCRQFGTLEIREAPMRTVIAMTANNLEVNRDIARRTILIRLDAHMERPEDRTGFKHPDIVGFTLLNRFRILGALASVVEAWEKAGKPLAPYHKGGYEGWSNVVVSLLYFMGYKDVLGNEGQMRERGDDSEVEWKGFFEAWIEKFGSSPVTTGELKELAESTTLLDAVMGDGNEKSKESRLGRAMTKRIGRICGGLYIERATIQRGKSRLKLEKVVDYGGLSTTTREKEKETDGDGCTKTFLYADTNSPPKSTSPPLPGVSENGRDAPCEPVESDDDDWADAFDPYAEKG